MERTISAMVGKGSLNHNNRTCVEQNVEENRIRNNVCYEKKRLKKLYHELFDEAVEEYNAKQKRKDRRIDDYYEKIENGKQEKLFHELILQIGNKDDMSALNPEDVKLAKDIFSEYMEAFQERNPNLVVFNAVLHLDEATPHVHIDYVPIMHNSKRGLRVRNSMKGALAELGFHGESKGSTEWSKWAESEKRVLAGIMKKFGIQWKQLGTHEKHLDVLDYKKKVRLQEVKELDEEIDRKSDTIMQQEDLIEEKQQQIENADIVLEISNRQISAAKDELDDIQKQAVTKEQEVKERNQQIKNADTILETKKIELDSMRNEVKHNQSKLVDVRREMTMEQSELRKVQDSVSDYRNELQSLHDEVVNETAGLQKVKEEKALALNV
ncbi:MAG: plasmid recombination protein, partial [Eubacterium sp.]|nr:plasmid recombination protein [Eubacterium sp.]